MSRQRQTFAKTHRSSHRISGRTAAYLLATARPPRSFIEATVELPCATIPAATAVAITDFRCGELVVRCGETVYYTASKFVPRYYVAVRRSGVWHFSYRDERTRDGMIARIETMLSAGELDLAV